MLATAFVLLGIAVVLGSVVAVLYLSREGRTIPCYPGALHGLLALVGLGCLVLALHGPPRGLHSGSASFGMISAVLLGFAALAGGGLLMMRLRKRPPASLLLGVHATLAVCGFVILGVYVLDGL